MDDPIRQREERLVDTFVVRARRERYKLLLAHPKRRKAFLDGLNHLRDLDPRHATEVPAGADVAALLRDRGAPARCHLISDVASLDGREMDLVEALDAVELGMFGTLVGCIPGRLAYYHGESGGQRMILERAGASS